MTHAIVRLARDRKWADALRERSRAAFRGHFDWDRIAEGFERLFVDN